VSGDRGLTVIDISDPAAPTVVGYVDTPGWAQDVAVMGQLALVADGLAGLQVIDVSDPRQPRRLGELATGGNAVAVAVADSRVLVAAQQGGLVLVDVTDPGQPRMIASVDTWRDAKGVIVDDGFVYVLEGSALSALDVSDPSAPVIVGYVTLPWDVVAAGFVEGGICAIGRYLLYEVPGGWDQYRGRILSVPRQCGTSTPCSLARFEAQAVAGGVHLLWRFVADGVRPRFRLVADNGRDSWDIDWFGSGAADEYEALDTARWLDTGDEVTYGLYLQGDDSQWLLLGTTTARPAPLAGGPRLLAPVPNPFNPSTAIRYHLPAGGAVRVAVFDLAGRRVRTLVHDERPRGDHEAFWDGRDDSGREVGSGTYLVRLESGGVSSAVTVGLVR